MKKTTISYDEWRAAIQEVEREKVDKIPPGWITIEEFARAADRSPIRARALLNNLCDFKRAERKQFRIENDNGLIRAVFHYRLIKKDEKNRPQAA